MNTETHLDKNYSYAVTVEKIVQFFDLNMNSLFRRVILYRQVNNNRMYKSNSPRIMQKAMQLIEA